ncbi:MAG: FAD-binding protein [Candidatus Bathyarchaeia archaeon]
MSEAPIEITDACTGCGVCVDVCPFNAIEIIDEKAFMGETCQACGVCVDACPEGAIIMREAEIEDLSQYRGVVVFAEHHRGELHPVAYELLGKGRELADTLEDPLYAVLIGSGLDEAAEGLSCRGADRVYVYDDPSLKSFRVDPYARILSEFLQKIKPSIVLIGATSIGRSLGPRVAARLETGLTADCTSLDIEPDSGLLLQTRPAYGGNIMATIKTPNGRPQMATVRYKVMNEAPVDESNRSEIIRRSIDDMDIQDRVTIKAYEPAPEEVSIVDADIIVSGGKGIGGPEGFQVIEELANTLVGAVGASRPTVDEGWINYRHQVGLSGRTVRPKLYIACGISGAVQHLAGMKTSDVIISINKDEEAPIFSVSNLGAVGDLHEVIPILIDKIKEYRTGE